MRLKTNLGAKNCIANAEWISNELCIGHRVKIAYSDFLKRNLIVSDDCFYKKNESLLTNMVFVSF